MKPLSRVFSCPLQSEDTHTDHPIEHEISCFQLDEKEIKHYSSANFFIRTKSLKSQLCDHVHKRIEIRLAPLRETIAGRNRNSSRSIVASYVIDPHMFSNPNFDSHLLRDCASRRYAVYSRSVFLSGLIMLRIKFPDLVMLKHL